MMEMNIIEQLEKEFQKQQKKDEKIVEKKSYSDMTDGEKLKVKTEQLKKAKAKNKELQAKVEFLEAFIKKNFKMAQPEKTSQPIPPKTV